MFKIFVAALKGTGAFRFYLQPLMATLRGIRHGKKDFQQGQLPLFNRFFGEESIKELLTEGLKDISPVLILALILDLYAQWEIFHYIYVFMTIFVIILIVLIPYFAARDFSNRIHRFKHNRIAT